MLRLLSTILYLPHSLLFLFSDKKDILIEDLYSRRDDRHNMLTIAKDLSCELFTSRYFRSVFYYRIDIWPVEFLRIFYPLERTFIINKYTKSCKGIKLVHPYATILHAESIADSLYINHLGTIGEIQRRKPVIANNVQLHAKRIIIGSVTIGVGAIIGASANVLKDVQTNAVSVNHARNIIKNV